MSRIIINDNYLLYTDSRNIALYKRKEHKENYETLVDENDIRTEFGILGYYNILKPDGLLKAMLVDHLIKESSFEYKSVAEFVKFFEQSVDRLVNNIDIKILSTEQEKINTLTDENILLREQLRTSRATATRLENTIKRSKPKCLLSDSTLVVSQQESQS